MSGRLALDGIACIRGGRLLFEGIDLALEPGDAAVVTGPNGVGKSSLLRVAAGLLRSAAGHVSREGRLALAADGLALDLNRPLGKALGHWARIDGRGARAVDDALDAMGIAGLVEIPVRMLSTGQRRRAAAARVIASGAALWLLDEPGNGLDPDGLARLGAAMTAHRAGGGIVLAATHQPIGLEGARELRAGRRAMSAFAAIVARDLRLAFEGGGVWLPLLFFLLVATLFPFAVGPDAALLGRLGGGALWTAALLAALLPVERLVAPDLAEGVFDQYAVRGLSEEAVAAAKIVAHWLSFGPPLMVAALPAAALFRLERDMLATLELGLLLGTPGLAALAVTVSALTAGLRRAGALGGVLMLPLAVPLLIFGAGALSDPASGGIKLFAAASLLLTACAPFATGAALRAARD